MKKVLKVAIDWQTLRKLERVAKRTKQTKSELIGKLIQVHLID